MTFDEKYEIIKNNDRFYDLKFYYAVKSTGIFCKPSCKSKIPNKENVEFFENIDEILEKGYRPCKRCRSELLEYNPSKEIATKIKEKIDSIFMEYECLNKELTNIGLSKKRAIEIFKEEYNITPREYINKLRIEYSKKLLVETDYSIIDIAFASGFKSVSAFYKIFKDKTNLTPNKYKKRNKETI